MIGNQGLDSIQWIVFHIVIYNVICNVIHNPRDRSVCVSENHRIVTINFLASFLLFSLFQSL